MNRALIFALIEKFALPVIKDLLIKQGRMPTDAEVIAELDHYTSRKIAEADAFLAQGTGSGPVGGPAPTLTAPSDGGQG